LVYIFTTGLERVEETTAPADEMTVSRKQEQLFWVTAKCVVKTSWHAG